MSPSARLSALAIGGLLAAGILAGCGGQSNGTGAGATPGSQVASSRNGGVPAGQAGAHQAASSFSSQAGRPSPGSNSNKSGDSGGRTKTSGGPTPSDNGGGGKPTPDGPETDNQANFGAAFSCFPGAHPDQGDCGRIEQFGADVAVGRTHTVAFTVATAASQPVTLASVAIEGDHADEYTLDTGTCTPGAQVNRADPGDDTTPPTPAQTCTLRITFTPTSAGLQRATLVIGADGDDRAMTISLRGTGAASPTAASASTG